MYFFLYALLFVSSLTQIIVSKTIYKKGRRNSSYLIFFWLSIVTLLWAFFNFLSVMLISSSGLIFIVRTILALGLLQIILFYLFTLSFPYGFTLSHKNIFSILLIIFLVISMLVFTPNVFSSLYVKNNVINADVNWGIGIFIFVAVSIISLAFRLLIIKFNNSIGMHRKQILIIMLAAILNWIIVPMTNLVFTLVFHTPFFAYISPIYSLVFALLIIFALTKHHLFDGKRVIRKSTIYVDYSLKNLNNRSIKYYELQSLVYNSNSDHIALDFTEVDNLDNKTVKMLKILRSYMASRGIKVYFINYSKKVFDQLNIVVK